MSSIIPALTVFIYEGRQLVYPDEEEGNPVCEFTLGTEEHRTRTAVAIDPLKPMWMEDFDLYLHDPQWNELKVSVWNCRIAGE